MCKSKSIMFTCIYSKPYVLIKKNKNKNKNENKK